MSFLRFIFTGVYSKETGSSLPLRGDTPRPMPQELHQLCVDLWYVSPSPQPCPPHREPAQPSPATQQFGNMHPQVLGNRVSDAFVLPTPPPAPGNEGLKRRSSHPCLALPCRPQSLLPREPEPTVWRTGRRSAKALTFQMFLWPQKCVCSPPLAPSLTGISPSWWSGTRGWWLAGSPRSG